MSKIVIVGAGGVIFSKKFFTDILLDERLRTSSEVVLMDISAERLENARIISELIAKKIGVEFNPYCTTNLREALKNADYVLTIFRCGTIEHQKMEYEIPMKFGVDQVVSDTLGPGGIFRGLRTLKDLLEVLDVMEEVCPHAYLLNYVNPMSMNTIALSKRAKTVKVIGLCHSVQHTANNICKWTDTPREKLRYLTAGVNHQAFFLKLEADGKSLYPKLWECFKKPEVYNIEKVRLAMMKHFGYFPTESSGHGSEYVPYFRKRQDLIDKYCSHDVLELDDYGVDWRAMADGATGASVLLCQQSQERNETQIREYLDGTREINIDKSHEYGVQIIRSIEIDEPFGANLNVMNYGLIPTLPPECCVEVPCLVDGGGINPCRIENYPEQLAALNRGMINVQILGAQAALTGDRRAVFHAMAADPNTASKLGLHEIEDLTNAMFKALGDQIDPRFTK